MSISKMLSALCALSILIACFLVSPPLACQAPKDDIDAISFFQTIVQHYNLGAPPKYDDVYKAARQIAASSADDVRVAVPWIIKALHYPDDRLKADAMLALFAIGQRQDGVKLLGREMPALTSLLDLENKQLQLAAVNLLGSLKPAPPLEVKTPILEFIKRDDRDTQAQAAALFVVAAFPKAPDIVQAEKEFLLKPLDKTSRMSALNALGRSTDPEIEGLVAGYLLDADKDIRFTTIQSLMRMGKSAVSTSAATLIKLAEDPQEAPEVRRAAKSALSMTQSSQSR
ncbi:MAG TPA: HEAT repeat domain-containing protein [Candidatus Saccharimonadales bacterium]|nr:HEAT repeat domain-containing protein [Candidatus Saccharimonadales bacterium]